MRMRLSRLVRPVGIGILLATFGPVRPTDVGAKVPRSSPAEEPVDPGAANEAAILHLLSRAAALLRLGYPEAAARLAKSLPATGPHGPAALRVRAWALAEAGHNARLAALLAHRDDLAGELLYLRGRARRRLHDPRGRADLRDLWWTEPDSVWGLAALGELASSGGPYTRAERAAIAHDVPRVTIDSAVGSGRSAERAIEHLEADAPHSGRLRCEVRQARGIVLLRAQSFNAAAHELRLALHTAPDPALRRAIELSLGEADHRRGAYDAAMRRFNAVAATGNDALAQQALAAAGQMAIEYRRYPEARRRFEAQLITNPVGPSRQQALWGLGWVAFRTGAFRTARRFFHTLLQEAPFGPLAPRALYWGARSSEEMGQRRRGRRRLVALIDRFPVDYYAYRAAAELGSTPWPQAATLPAEQPDPRVQHVAGLVKAGMLQRARRAAMSLGAIAGTQLGPEDLQQLVQVAGRLQNPKLAQRFVAARTERFPRPDAADIKRLGKLFPGYYLRLLEREAKRQHVTPELVAALVRQESLYNPRAVSPVGAVGLMQLMPKTARKLVQERHRHAHPRIAAFFDAKTNLRLGIRYLGRVLRAFSGRREYALAAYNAGPAAVTRWRAARGDLPEEIFVEEIPYAETATYVRRVLGWLQMLVFIERTGATNPTRVTERLVADRRPAPLPR